MSVDNKNLLKYFVVGLIIFSTIFFLRGVIEEGEDKRVARSKVGDDFSTAKKELPEKIYLDSKGDINPRFFLEETKTKGLIVVRGNEIIHESYYLGKDEETKFNLKSGTSSFLTLIMGLAVEDGKVDLNKPVSYYITDLKGSVYDNILVKHVLELTTGTRFPSDLDVNFVDRSLESDRSYDYFLKPFKSAKIESDPGSYIDPFEPTPGVLLGFILQESTDYNLSEYVEKNLWNPLGATDDFKWKMLNREREVPFSFFYATLRDWEKIGRLMLFEGGDLISEDWIKKITKPQEKEIVEVNDYYENFYYGLQWLVPRNRKGGEFMSVVGSGGRYIYVNPDKNIVIIKMGEDHDYTTNYPLNIDFLRSLADYYSL